MNYLIEVSIIEIEEQQQKEAYNRVYNSTGEYFDEAYIKVTNEISNKKPNSIVKLNYYTEQL